MVNDGTWIASDKVTEDGYYWCDHDNDLFIVEVSKDVYSEQVFVWSFGRDYPAKIEEVGGLFDRIAKPIVK
jgi:hypothetical protein